SAARLAVNPVSRIRIAADLEIIFQLLIANRPSLFKQDFDLTPDQRVSLESGRAVRLLPPDVRPDGFGLLGAGQATEPTSQLFNSKGQPVMEALAGRASP